MSEYKIITEADGIVLKKKDNKFKLEASKRIKVPCNIIESVENLEIYNLFKLLNENLINKCKIMQDDKNNETDILIFLNDISSDSNANSDSDSDNPDNKPKKYYVSFTNLVTRNGSNEIKIEGKKNSVKVNLDDYKKLEIDDILINFKITSKSELLILFKFNYIGEKIPIYMENTIGLVFRKIMKNLLKYYSE
jgi:hypothetical protein